MKISEIITISIIAIAIAATTVVTISGLLLSVAEAQQVAPQSPPPSGTTATTTITTTTNDDDDDDDDDNSTTARPPLTTSTTPANMTATTTAANASSANKIFYLFSDEVDEDLDDDGGIHGQGFTGDDDIDVYSLHTMVVNIGDIVTVQFFNVDDDDDSPERHSFTLGAPYNIDADLAGGESTVVTFPANTEGIFQYYSKYNMPQMTGQLVVLP